MQTPLSRDAAMRRAVRRLGDITREIQAGYNILRRHDKTVTIFGSARLPKDSPYYQAAQQISYQLSKRGYAIVSGGGYGIMGAANQGAEEAGGPSIGFNIELPHEQVLNDYATESLEFDHFAPRKIMMTLCANAYIYFPGGFGTFDELFEILTLVQTGKTMPAPIILYGSTFWGPIDRFIGSHMRELGLISDGDQCLYRITDQVDEAVRLVESPFAPHPKATPCDHSGAAKV